MYDFRRKFRLKVIYPSGEIIGFDPFFFCERTSLSWSSTASTDEDDLFRGVYFFHPKRKDRKRDIASSWDMDFIIFARTADIDKVDGLWWFFEKCWEFFWGESKHREKKN